MLLREEFVLSMEQRNISTCMTKDARPRYRMEGFVEDMYGAS